MRKTNIVTSELRIQVKFKNRIETDIKKPPIPTHPPAHRRKQDFMRKTTSSKFLQQKFDLGFDSINSGNY